MHIVIDIPDEKYNRLPYIDIFSLREYIENGIVLPKGHGRLIDADAVSLEDISFFSISDYQKMVHKLTTSCPTIIEADNDSEEKK